MTCFIEEYIQQDIINTIGNRFCESGGLLGSSKDGVIDSYYFDEGKINLTDKYVPKVETMNVVLEEWSERNIKFIGIIHSHLEDAAISSKDIIMARKILAINDSLESVLMPVYTLKDKKIRWYEIDSNKLNLIQIEILKKGD